MEYDFPSQVDNLEAKVPEPYRGYYVANADKTGFVIDEKVKPLVEMYTGVNKAFKEATNLKTKNGNEAAARRQALTKVADVATTILGLDLKDKNLETDLPDMLGTALADMASKVTGGEQIKINMARVQEAADKRVKDIETAAQTRVTGMQGALERYLVGEAATRAVADAKGAVDLLLPHVKASVKVVQQGDDYVPVVVDEKGEARPNGKGGFMSIPDLVAEMKASDKFARAFESEARAGSGTKPGAQQQKPPARTGELSSTDKISQGLAARKQ